MIFGAIGLLIALFCVATAPTKGSFAFACFALTMAMGILLVGFSHGQ